MSNEKKLTEMNLKELQEAEKDMKDYIFCQECANDFYYTQGNYNNDKAYLNSIKAQIKEVENQLEELEAKKVEAYGRYMYEECAEKGYNANAAHKAHSEYLDFCIKIDKLRGRKESDTNEI